MERQLLIEIRQFLAALESTQNDMLSLFERKRAALHKAIPSELMQLAEPEAELASRMQRLLQHRGRILEAARQAGLPDESVQVLVGRIGSGTGDLTPRIQRAKYKSDELRRESWVQWVITHRACSHYGNLLDIIANCGEKRPTYSQDQGHTTSGGAILDASA